MHAKILLVDDEPRLRRVLVQLLEDAGAQLVEAESAEAAADKISNNYFDLLIVDKNLPAQNGIDLAARLIKKQSVAAALMMTGYPSVRSLIEACNADICAYMIKPFAKLQNLLDEVSAILNRQNQKNNRPPPPPPKPPVLAQDIISWLHFTKQAEVTFDRFSIDLHDPQRSLRVAQHIRKLGNQIVPVNDNAEVIIGDHYDSLKSLLQKHTASAGLYIGQGLGFDEVLAFMRRGRVAIATEEMFAKINNGEPQP